MKKSTQYLLARITLFGIGVWLLVSLITSKTINFTSNRTETILGGFTALSIALVLLWIADYKQKRKAAKDNTSRNK